MKGVFYRVKYLGFPIRTFSLYGSALRYLFSCADKVQVDYCEFLPKVNNFIIELDTRKEKK